MAAIRDTPTYTGLKEYLLPTDMRDMSTLRSTKVLNVRTEDFWNSAYGGRKQKSKTKQTGYGLTVHSDVNSIIIYSHVDVAEP